MGVDVVPGRRQGLTLGQVRPALLEAEQLPDRRVLGRGVEAAPEDREQRDEVVAVPVAVDVGLADPDPRATAELLPERLGATDVDEHGRPGSVAEAAPAAAREPEHDLAALDALERLQHEPLRQAPEHAHGRSDPLPGTNGGRRWNGARFSQSRAACQWMRATTVAGISG